MSKKIFVNRKQAKAINESINVDRESIAKLPMHISDDIIMNDTALSENEYIPFGNKTLKQYLLKRINHLNSVFNNELIDKSEEDIENKLSKLISICQKKEKNITTQLEQIAYDSLIEIFNFNPDDLDYDGQIVNVITNTNFTINPNLKSDNKFNSIKDIEEHNTLIQKRKFFNCLNVGFSQYSVFTKLYELKDELNNLEEGIYGLYIKILLLNEYLNLIKDIKLTDDNPQQGGYVKSFVSTENSVSKIEARGIVFPILLFESIKGVMEILSSYNLPDDKEHALDIMDKCDNLNCSIWYERFGMPLWETFIQGTEFDTNLLPYILNKLFNVNSDGIKEIMMHTTKGDEIIEQIFNSSKHDYDYQGFEQDMVQKQQQNKTLISDSEYFSDEELLENENNSYNVNLDEFIQQIQEGYYDNEIMNGTIKKIANEYEDDIFFEELVKTITNRYQEIK